MDREYTFRFFYDRTMLSVDEPTAFSEMFTRMLRVARAHGAAIRGVVGDAWNTGPAKVVDNAIVGYLIAREGVYTARDRLFRRGRLAD